MQKNHLYELSSLALIKCEGENSAKFLQGQFTCDLNKISSNTMRQGAICGIKGTVLALVDIIYWQNAYYLVLPANLVEQTLNSLAKTALLSRVKLQDVQEYSVFGLNINDRFDKPLEPFEFREIDGYCYYCFIRDYYIFVVKQEDRLKVSKDFSEIYDYTAWHYLLLQKHRIQIYPETRGSFFPHRLNLHNQDFISFDKGCYKGQEIVARMHYKAKLKHELKSFFVSSEAAIKPGQKIYEESSDRELGEIIDVHQLDTEKYYIVVSILIEHPSVVRFEGSDKCTELDPADKPRDDEL